MKQHEYNLNNVKKVALKLDSLLEQVVFVGGAIISFLLTDPATPDVRVTEDIDLIFEVSHLIDYYLFSDKLRNKGFIETSDNNVICRWKMNGLIIDIMPTDKTILGFSNIWYKEAAKNSNQFNIDSTLTIKLISAPYFMATKLEAFKDRGNRDFFLSHDLEDIITLIDGRSELIEEIKNTNSDLRSYIKLELNNLLQNAQFYESIVGHLGSYSSNVAYRRRDIVLDRIKAMC